MSFAVLRHIRDQFKAAFFAVLRASDPLACAGGERPGRGVSPKIRSLQVLTLVT